MTARKCAECAADIFAHAACEVDEADLRQILDVCAETTPSVIMPDEMLVGSFRAALTECGRNARTVVVNCAGRGIHEFLPKTKPPFDALRKQNRVYDLEWRDDGAFVIDVPELIAALEWAQGHVRKGSPVVFNCAQGKSRSATAACAYIMATRGVSAAEALAMVKERRPFVQPNPSFMVQLVAMQDAVRSSLRNMPTMTTP